MRKDTAFPLGEIFFLDFLRFTWEEGWLDEYSDDHFLIRAIEKRLDDFVGKTQRIGNELNMQHRTSQILSGFTGMYPDEEGTLAALMDYKVKSDEDKREANRIGNALSNLIQENAKTIY